MGDFNAVSNPERDRSHQKANHNSWKPEIELYNFLEDWSFTDVQELLELDMPTPTWSNNFGHSQIDYIWTSNEITLENIYDLSNEKIENITGSDHTLLTLRLKRDMIMQKSRSTVKKKVLLDFLIYQTLQ